MNEKLSFCKFIKFSWGIPIHWHSLHFHILDSYGEYAIGSGEDCCFCVLQKICYFLRFRRTGLRKPSSFFRKFHRTISGNHHFSPNGVSFSRRSLWILRIRKKKITTGGILPRESRLTISGATNPLIYLKACGTSWPERVVVIKVSNLISVTIFIHASSPSIM